MKSYCADDMTTAPVTSVIELSEEVLPLFKRDGVYYTHVRHSTAGEPIEIALHGVTSEEQARAAAEALAAFPPV